MKKFFVSLITCILVLFAVNYLINSNSLKDKIIGLIHLEEIEENNLQNEHTRYWYELLNEDEKKIYRIIANSVANFEKNITVSYNKSHSFEQNKRLVEKALDAFFSDNPDVFYIKDKYEISITNILVLSKVELRLEYISNDIDEIEKMKQELNTEVERINRDLESCKTDYEKELALHDILGREIVYFEHENYEDIPSIQHTAYSALVDKSAVCDGITKAFQLILSKNNIESIFVTGMTEDIPHAWCKVKLDGEYYNVDVTSDKALNKDNKDLVIHSYFNITDKEIMNSHKFDNYDNLPKSEGSKYNYYTYNDYVVLYQENFQNKLNKVIHMQKNNNILEFKALGIKDVPSKMVDALYNLNFNDYKSKRVNKVEYTKINDNYIIVK